MSCLDNTAEHTIPFGYVELKSNTSVGLETILFAVETYKLKSGFLGFLGSNSEDPFWEYETLAKLDNEATNGTIVGVPMSKRIQKQIL